METKQLYEQVGNEYKPINPSVSLNELVDKESDLTFGEILSKYNHLKVNWKGDASSTRNEVPIKYRRNGLYITYNNGTDVVTEYYVGSNNSITTETWTADSNWKTPITEDWINANMSKLKPAKDSVGYEQLTPALRQLVNKNTNVTNYPDDEDLTSQDNLLKFKDREYNEEEFSGKGYVILRKNLKKVNGVTKNILEQSMINKENTIYEIRYDFDLNGETINIPENCVLKFEGGMISNGEINLNYCDIINGRITAFPVSVPVNNLFKISDFCISCNSSPSYNNKMIQRMIDLNAKIFINVNERITFEKPLYNIRNDFYGLYDIKPILDTSLNDCILYFPNSKGIVCEKLATRQKISNLVIKSLEDSITINSSYILFFENLTIYSQKGSCFVTKPSPKTFQIKFSNIIIYCKDGKYGFNSFNGNTTTFEDITILKCGVSAFNNCCGYFNRINGCWGDTPHFMTAYKTLDDEKENYSVQIYLNETNIESYEDTPIDFKDSLFRNVSLTLTNTSIYNYKDKISGKYTHPYIKAHALQFNNYSFSCNYSEEEYENDIYPITIEKTSPYNASTILSYRHIELYDYNFNKLLVYERNMLTKTNISKYIQDAFNYKKNTYNNYKFDKLILSRSFWDKKEIIYPSETDRLQINLLEGQYFSISAEKDIEDTKIVQLSEQYVNNAINYGDLNRSLDFITIHNNCKISKLKVYGTNVFFNYAIINPNESCSFINLNGQYRLYSIDGFLTQNNQNTIAVNSTVQENNDGLLFFNSIIKKILYSCDGKWIDIFGNPSNTKYNGISSSRPANVIIGTVFFDKTINKPIFWNGIKWIDCNGNDPDNQTKGTTSQRPTNISVGFEFYDTTLKKKILWNGTDWVNVDGSSLSN